MCYRMDCNERLQDLNMILHWLWITSAISFFLCFGEVLQYLCFHHTWVDWIVADVKSKGKYQASIFAFI